MGQRGMKKPYVYTFCTLYIFRVFSVYIFYFVSVLLQIKNNLIE